MSRKKDSNRLPPFVPLPWELLNSRAYKDLKYASAKSLPLFLGKIKESYRDIQRYLIEFSFSYREAKQHGYAPATFSKIIRELVGKGFIDPVDKGGLRSDGKSTGSQVGGPGSSFIQVPGRNTHIVHLHRFCRV